MAQRTCASCGIEVPAPSRGRSSAYCAKCACGTSVGRDLHRRRGEEPCEPCRLAWNSFCRARRAAAKARGWQRPSQTTYPRTCDQCEAAYEAKYKASRFCSQACYGMSQRKVPVTALVLWAPRPAPPTPVTVVRAPKWWAVIVNGPCAWCAETFTATGSTTIYCSRRCQRQATQSRRGRFVISPVRRLALYERDEWTCMLCHEPVERGGDPLGDWAPSLDHIEPQSHALIPDHSDANLRTSHRWCNAVRGAAVNDDFFEEVA